MGEDQPTDQLTHRFTDTITILPQQPTGNSKFDIAMRTRELRELENILKAVHDMEPAQKTAWIQENGDMMAEAFDQFVAETGPTLENLSFDTEVLNLSKELVSTLRDTSELLDGLVGATPRLRS